MNEGGPVITVEMLSGLSQAKIPPITSVELVTEQDEELTDRGAVTTNLETASDFSSSTTLTIEIDRSYAAMEREILEIGY